MISFEVSQSQEELTTHSGLALVGLGLKGTDLNKRVNNYKLSGIKSEASISHSDVIRSEVGLLCQGKSEYEGIEDFRGGGGALFWQGHRSEANAIKCDATSTSGPIG